MVYWQKNLIGHKTITLASNFSSEMIFILKKSILKKNAKNLPDPHSGKISSNKVRKTFVRQGKNYFRLKIACKGNFLMSLD